MNPSNQISVIGNVGENPAAKAKTRAGKNVVAFAIAQNVTGVDPESGARVTKDPQWFRVTCFGNLADRVLANAKKGDLLLVAGALKARNYTDKAGAKRIAFEIVAGDVLKVERLRLPRDETGPAGTSASAADVPNFDEWAEEGIGQ